MNSKHVKTLLGRLNEFCSRALENAAEFATARTHYEVTIEHFVIKLIEQGDGDMERALEKSGVNLDDLWQGMLDNLARQKANNAAKPAFSPMLLSWLEKALSASALYYDEDVIRGVSLLDALVEIAPTLPGTAFACLDGVSLDALRRNHREILKSSVEPQWSYTPPLKIVKSDGKGKKAAPGKAGRKGESGETALARFTEELTQKARDGKIDPVLGRDEEVRLMIDILSRRRKNNPILVGDPGVGKTALVEGLATRIAAGEVPTQLAGVRLHVLDMGLLQAGAGVKGEFEKRLRQVIDEVKNSATPIILFIDEAHTLIGAGGEAGMSDAANLLKPALARGELRTIAATTWSEYKKYFERDAALERRFQLVKVDEPSIERAIVMLNGLKQRYQEHHGILITDDAINAAVTLSDRYINGRYLPDKAIDLLDTAAARIRMSQAVKPSDLEAAESHVRHLEKRLAFLREEEAHGIDVDPRLIQTLKKDLDETRKRIEQQHGQWSGESVLVDEIRACSEKLRGLAGESGGGKQKAHDRLRLETRQARERLKTLQGELPMVQVEVNESAIAEIIADWTGVPVGNMVKDDIARLMEFEARIGSRVIGQTPAIAAIARAIRSSRAGLKASESPLGVFLLAGPSGVGKTETARAIAEEMFGGERFLVTINMSEYQEAHTVSQLKGSPPGYVGYGEGGVLTEAVRQRPYSVVLLDEVEKAHPDVMNLFYQVFDRGFMRDGEGREIDFKNTVIIMTSNLGTDEIVTLSTPADSESAEDNAGKAWRPPTFGEVREAIQPALLRHFAPAMLGRMQVVPYLPLQDEALANIVALKLDQVAQRLKEAHDMAFRVQSEALTYLAARCAQTDTGARFINSMIDQQLLPEVARSLLAYMADDDMPDILTLELDEQGELSLVFADHAADGDDTTGEGEARLQAGDELKALV